jgi:enterochelin esterase family protein
MAPNAKAVKVVLEIGTELPMTMDDHGVWSATSPPLTPDLYVYHFAMDGLDLADPANLILKPIATGGAECIVEVGASSQDWARREVPHGVLHRHSFASSSIGETRSLLVYTPPGYDPKSRQTYPVLVLLHGVMETETAWSVAGRAEVILDNLISEGKAKPMILVMPLGYGFKSVPDNMSQQFGGPATQRQVMDTFAKSLIEEILPLVERSYRVSKGAAAHAIAGASLGGAQALYIGLNHADQFAWVGCFSAASIVYGQNLTGWFPGLSGSINKNVRLLDVDCGRSDFLFKSNEFLKSWLTSKGVKFESRLTDGAHTWNVWRPDLIDFAPKLFR